MQLGKEAKNRSHLLTTLKSVTNPKNDELLSLKKVNLDEPLPLLTRKKPVQIVEEDLTKKAILKFMKNKDVPMRLPNPGNNREKTPEGSGSDYSQDSPHREAGSPQMDEFEPRELKQEISGWHLYKKFKFNYQPVRRYINLVQEDF